LEKKEHWSTGKGEFDIGDHTPRRKRGGGKRKTTDPCAGKEETRLFPLGDCIRFARKGGGS